MKYFVLLFLCLSCGHLHPNPEVSAITEEQTPAVTNKADLIERAHSMILESDQLDTEQKEKMILLMEETSQRSQVLDEQIYAAKWMLFQSLVGTKKTENKRKRDLLAIELRRLSAQKVELMIEALYQTEEILGTSTLEFKPSIFLDQNRLSH